MWEHDRELRLLRTERKIAALEYLFAAAHCFALLFGCEEGPDAN